MAKLLLVVEDEPFLISMYKLKLEKAGYDVILAKNGDEAYRQIQSRTPDLIILDLVMPLTDGFKFLEQIRTEAKWHSLPILVVSNLGQDEDKLRAQKLGVSRYLVKANVTLEEIIRNISEMLSTSTQP